MSTAPFTPARVPGASAVARRRATGARAFQPAVPAGGFDLSTVFAHVNPLGLLYVVETNPIGSPTHRARARGIGLSVTCTMSEEDAVRRLAERLAKDRRLRVRHVACVRRADLVEGGAWCVTLEDAA